MLSFFARLITCLTGIGLLLLAATNPRVVENVPHDPSTSGVCVPSSTNNWCAPVGHPDVAAAIETLEAEGLVCSDESAITDTIVFQYKSDERVEVVDFDTAYSLGKEGLGWTQAFCS